MLQKDALAVEVTVAREFAGKTTVTQVIHLRVGINTLKSMLALFSISSDEL
jgi:hypothetical protein